MFGKAKQEEAVATEKASEKGLTMLKLCLPQIMVVVLIVLISGYLAYLQYAGLVKDSEQVQHVANAERMAALLGGRLVALGDQVADQAHADKALASAILRSDLTALRKFEAKMHSRFPEAVRVRVILPEDIEPDNSVTPPIGYACLDLARQAESGVDRPPLEVHLHGQPHAHLDLVRPLSANGDALASLMVSFSPDKIAEWMGELTLEAGYVELQQGWDGPILGSLGSSGTKEGKATHRAVIYGSTWQLSYWAEDGIGMAEAQKVGFLATFGIAGGVIAVFMFFYTLFVSGTIKGELQRMAEFMVESSRGKRFHSYPVKMLEMERALEMMEQVLKQEKDEKPGADIKSKAEEGDEGASDMMFMDFGEITVEETEDDFPGDADKESGDTNKS